MCNGNVYKKFCAIMIVLGLVLCGGQYSYAHSPELKAAETNAKANPTIENLERLYNLYKQDVEYHKSRREYDEERESEIGAAWARAQKAGKIAENDGTPENLGIAANCWDEAAALFERTWDSTIAAEAKACAAWARAQQATKIAENNKTPENFENMAKCWDKTAALYEEAGNSTKATMAKANAAWARAQKVGKIAEINRTPKNLENEANCWDKAATLYEEAGNTTNAARAKACAAWARAEKVQFITRHAVLTQKNLKNEAKCWDKAAVLKEKAGEHTSAAWAKARAAWVRARKAIHKADKIVSLDNYETPENFENKAKYWDKAAAFYEEAGDSTEAARTKAFAASARARKAELIAMHDATPENFENEAKSWDEVAALKKEIGDTIGAANARTNAALARARKAHRIADNDKTPENLENEANCWDKLAYLYSKYKGPIDIKRAEATAAWARAEKAELIASHDPTVKNYQNMIYYWDNAAALCTKAMESKAVTAAARNNAAQAKIGLAQAKEEKKLFKLMIGLILADHKN